MLVPYQYDYVILYLVYILTVFKVGRESKSECSFALMAVPRYSDEMLPINLLLRMTSSLYNSRANAEGLKKFSITILNICLFLLAECLTLK